MKRVWIYQSSRFLTDEEVAVVTDILQEFVSQWTAHGNQLAGSFEVRYHLFIILQVDEEKAMVTGCSIDKSVHLLKKIEATLGVSLFDRLNIAYRDQNMNIQIASRDEFERLVTAGIVDQRTVVFNNMVTSAEDLTDKWEIPISESWHAKVFF
ncbi:hypothetical protein BC792_101199 [Sphingobacterium allocomposti]|uniref:ABC transporter ATPase n=1 Tax=Sphingobacterium allocomposti TaxID=415956 RepID=A0A5S5DUR2_9SPHI|nr:ABC transporter ATPase [Sphingobacterium composti Yoo et al. 2007 non Ten et al. 2007]TYP98542.1 hypothetical protein BC792_101199 [Sphingobacterium composti Yoo et al. 2007 non Ten et al. 2007]